MQRYAVFFSNKMTDATVGAIETDFLDKKKWTVVCTFMKFYAAREGIHEGRSI